MLIYIYIYGKQAGLLGEEVVLDLLGYDQLPRLRQVLVDDPPRLPSHTHARARIHAHARTHTRTSTQQELPVGPVDYIDGMSWPSRQRH